MSLIASPVRCRLLERWSPHDADDELHYTRHTTLTRSRSIGVDFDPEVATVFERFDVLFAE